MPGLGVHREVRANYARTINGAGSGDADVHQTLFVVEDDNLPGDRFICLGKRRFEPTVTELRVRTETRQMVGEDEFGDLITFPSRYGLLEPMEESRQEIAEVAREEQTRNRREGKVLAAVHKAMGEADLQGLFISNLVKSVGGGSATRELIREMVAGDTLIELEVPEDLRPPRSKASLQSLASSGTDPDAFFNRVREVQKAQESGQG